MRSFMDLLISVYQGTPGQHSERTHFAPRKPRRLGVAVVLLTLLGGTRSFGEPVEEARKLWLGGKTGEAIEFISKIKSDPEVELSERDRLELVRYHARCLADEGQLAEAIALLEAEPESLPDFHRVWSEIAEYHFNLGQLDLASTWAERALGKDNSDVRARWVRAQVLSSTGKLNEAKDELDWFIDYYNKVQPTDAEELFLVSRGAIESALRGQLHDDLDFILSEMLVDAVRDEPNYWPAMWLSGHLLLMKYNKAEGVPELKNALKVNPNAAIALANLAISAVQDYDFTQANQFAQQALAINPKQEDALRVLADVAIADRRPTEALEVLTRAREVNPVREETLGRLAAVHYILGQPELAEALEAEVLARNPKPGVFYTDLAEQLVTRWQLDLAEKYFLKAIDLVPYLATPRNGLGMLYMRVGKEDEARAVFEQARKVDPYHVQTLNMKKVLDHMKDYVVEAGDKYAVYVHPQEDRLLGKYMLRYIENKHAELCQRYGFEPPERTKIEVLQNHKWFSARVVGLPNIGTVGACTGKVVALASPRSLGQQSYHWGRVVTHEVTHVITLQQTDFRIPHWFTEALAVLSEGYAYPEEWNGMLQRRVPKGEIIPIDDLNIAFIRPKKLEDRQMAYCQSLLIAEFIIDRFGEEKIAAMLDGYREGKETPEVIAEVFSLSQADFETEFRQSLEKRVAAISTWKEAPPMTLAEAEQALKDDPANAEAAARLAWLFLQKKKNIEAREKAEQALASEPDQPLARLVLARLEFSIGKVDDAIAYLEPAFQEDEPHPMVVEMLASLYLRKKRTEDAIRLYELGNAREPNATRWLKGLAAIYLESKDDARLKPILEQLAHLSSEDVKVRLKLALMAEADGDWEAGQRWSWEVLFNNVDDPAAHRILAKAYLGLGKASDAIDEFQVAMELDPTNRELQLGLARSLEAAGREEDARAALAIYLEKGGKDPEAEALRLRLGNP